MTISISERKVRATSKHVPYYKGGSKKVLPPGKVVGVISRKPIEDTNEFNTLVIYLTVNRYRPDFTTVIRQSTRSRKLPAYSQDLFHSCFKNW